MSKLKEIKEMVKFMTKNHVQHLKFDEIELSLSLDAFNSTGEASKEIERHKKQSGDLDQNLKKNKDPFFDSDEDEEEILLHST